jgi:hypothetical protein|tara:strand:- start:219 stop:446 length:228 start_codon:yes stop_codon:yes gene_type:complete
MSKINLLLKIFIVFILFTSESYAYLDPGTGSIILQVIIGFIAATVATISIYWNKFKLFISKLFKKKEKEKKNIND